jgi:hypothetical protein
MENLSHWLDEDPILHWLHENDLPLTREYYIAMATLTSPEDYEWDEEDEMGMPEPLRDLDALARERSEKDTASSSE